MLLTPVLSYAQEIEEGPIDRIWKVKVEGNTVFEDVVIESHIANEAPTIWKKITFFFRDGYEVSDIEIRKDAIRIERFYHRRGYNDASVTYRIDEGTKVWRKELVFIVSEGTPIRIDSIRVELDASEEDKEIISGSSRYQRSLRRIPYRQGRVYEPVKEPEVIGELTQTIRNLGYPYTESTVVARVDTLGKRASLVISTIPGPRARFDSLIIDGESTIEEHYIERETGIKKGEYFSESDMRDAQREVFKHHLFRYALISIPEQPKDTTLDVLLRVKELPLRSVQMKLGAGDFDRLEERIAFDNFYKLFRTQVSWEYRNVRGRGERFTTTGRYSYFHRKISAEYLFPYVYNTKSSININPFYEYKDEVSYDILTGGIINTFAYQYNRNLTGTFSYEYAINNESNVKLSDNNPTVGHVLPDSLLSYNVSTFAFSLYYTRIRESGGRGLVIQPYWELSGLFGESTFSYQKFTLDVRRYFNLNDNLVMATRARGGTIYYAKQDSIPSDIEFYTGGTNSVRGWKRQYLGPKEAAFRDDGTFRRYLPTGGRVLFNFNIEFRQDLDAFLKGFGVAAFLDGGQVWRKVESFGDERLQYGAGMGLRYNSPIGPIRVDVAYMLNPNEQDLNIYQGIDKGDRWQRWGLHFSIGQAF